MAILGPLNSFVVTSNILVGKEEGLYSVLGTIPTQLLDYTLRILGRPIVIARQVVLAPCRTSHHELNMPFFPLKLTMA